MIAETTGKRKLAVGRILWTAFGAVISALLTWEFSHLFHNSVDLIAVVATIFSILAAALIAIISILGDPSMLMDQSWRHNTLLASETQRKLHRKTDIFILYIVILGLLLVFALTDKESEIYRTVQVVVFFSITFGFWASLSLPHTLKEIQRKRLNDAIAAKKVSARR